MGYPMALRLRKIVIKSYTQISLKELIELIFKNNEYLEEIYILGYESYDYLMIENFPSRLKIFQVQDTQRFRSDLRFLQIENFSPLLLPVSQLQ